MSWTCPCTAIQPDGARFCDRCGKPMQLSPVPRANPSTSHAWKLGAIAGVLIVGVIFGSLVAMAVFGGGSTQATAQATPRAGPGIRVSASFRRQFQKLMPAIRDA